MSFIPYPNGFPADLPDSLFYALARPNGVVVEQYQTKIVNCGVGLNDGFSGSFPVVTVTGLPSGVTASGYIPYNDEVGYITLSADGDATPGTYSINYRAVQGSNVDEDVITLVVLAGNLTPGKVAKSIGGKMLVAYWNGDSILYQEEHYGMIIEYDGQPLDSSWTVLFGVSTLLTNPTVWAAGNVFLSRYRGKVSSLSETLGDKRFHMKLTKDATDYVMYINTIRFV